MRIYQLMKRSKYTTSVRLNFWENRLVGIIKEATTFTVITSNSNTRDLSMTVVVLPALTMRFKTHERVRRSPRLTNF